MCSYFVSLQLCLSNTLSLVPYFYVSFTLFTNYINFHLEVLIGFVCFCVLLLIVMHAFNVFHILHLTL